MKKLVVFIAYVMIVMGYEGYASPATQLNWFSAWDAAVAAAKNDNRRMLVMFSTEWCPYCNFMEEKIFTKDTVIEKLGQFVLFKADGDKREIQGLMDKYDVGGFPTFIVMTSDGRELVRFNDVNETAELIRLLDSAKDNIPGHKELKSAAALMDRDDKKGAYPLYLKAYNRLKNTKDPVLEDALAGLLRTVGDVDKGLAYGRELLKKFPDSAYLPNYHYWIGQLYTTTPIKQKFLQQAIDVIEKRLEGINNEDEKTVRILTSQHIDLLAEAYKGMGRSSRASSAYEKGAVASEKMIKKLGGIAKNTHMINTTVYYYTSAGKTAAVRRFLKEAMAEANTYWPVYFNYAKLLLSDGKTDKAMEYAKKAYQLAEDVAKPKAAFVMADIFITKGDKDAAMKVLKDEEAAIGANPAGRAKSIAKQLKDRIKEIASL